MRALLVATLLAACNPYDPDLGTAPFLCGTDEPRCPEGYVAMDVSVIRCECQKPSRIDGGGVYLCNGDPNEPNESTGNATLVTIGQNLAINYDNLAICPAADEDHYRMNTVQSGSIIVARVTFDRTRSAPRISILADSGALLTMINDSPEAGVVVATFTATYSGTYYARIQGDVEVNFNLRLMITPPS